MRFRGKSIRRKIVALLLVPLVALTALWAFATVITGKEAAQLLTGADVMRRLGHPAEDMAQALQKERRQTLVYLADMRRSDALEALRAQRRATDKTAVDLRSGAGHGVRDDMSAASADQFTTIEDGLDDLAGLRRKVEHNTLTRDGALRAYNELIDPYYAFLGTLNTLQDADMDKQGRALVGVTRAREALSREDALLAAGLAAGSMNRQEIRAFSDRIAERKLLYTTNLPVLPASDQNIYADFWRGADARALEKAEEAVLAAGPAKAVQTINSQRWEAAVGPVLEDLRRMGADASDRYQDRVKPIADDILLKAGAAGVLGFLALAVSLVISTRIGRSLIRDLRRVRKEAHEVSGVRLPSVMRRLAAGENVDVETEAPRLQYGQDELGQVGQALNTLQRAAVEAAVKQADMRRGVSEVFVNLARRSQVLLHRQLTLLDTMERRTEDTDELADLFRLDHLTTRMRRHAEGLVILSGAAPSRQWRKPIPLMDVVRAAVAEVEDYERIEVRRLARLAVSGPAVADLTHLVAELLENATLYSPPHTAVQVVGERVSNGFTLEIHDRGLGMTPDAQLEANLRLAETPEFELSDTDRLGLFVVSRLARRQGVRVSLQPSPYGGTTAVVLIPEALLVDAGTAAGHEREPDTGESAAGGSGLAALAQVPVPLPERPDADRPALAGPAGERLVYGAFDEAEGALFRRRAAAPAPEQHQQAAEAPAPTRPDGPAPLPRRRTAARAADHRPPDAEDGAAGARRDEKTLALPRRVRQASLAPQLKNDPAARTAAAGPADPEPERDADEVRARMASLQRGWQRGREHNALEPDGAAGTAPGTTSEGDGR
ncbi:sensor histidine kinase [Streptomyces varsoviensis]|uniref:histidine kinase n=1 Tax=Streptomyces varsoviensis TaxID=67373 RepID=A0ABR5IQQ5_9ACTN|nr:nitrate- and nitrite sensing domain-containing protein [Streptomyces varsoviensis]KOG36302.1 histidine kinase [Streptomyces varsoviensis]